MTTSSATYRSPPQLKAMRLRPARLLVAAPVAAVALATAELLRSAGHAVIGPACSPDEALELAARHKVELALVDLGFGYQGADEPAGLVLGLRLREERRAPCLFVAAPANPFLCGDQGVGCLEKPATAELLLIAVDAALRLLREDMLPHSLPPGLRLWRPEPLRELAA